MTIEGWLKTNTVHLTDAGIQSARVDCLLLLENELNKSREWVLGHSEIELKTTQLQRLNTMIARRMKREPIAYIIGSKEFYGRTFFVTPDVLIPRPESESCIEVLTKSTPCAKDGPWRILDVGTGSGCLAITAKLELPGAHVIASDISDKALTIARKNAKRLGAEIKFIKSDLLSALSDTNQQLPTIILANLPYVPDNFITSAEITKEPAIALFSGIDGLDHYRTFWHQVNDLDHKPKYIITESLEDQHKPLLKLANNAGYELTETKTLAQLFSLQAPLPT